MACQPKLAGVLKPAFANGLRRAAYACRVAAGEGWWEVLVTLQFVASDFVF